MSRTPARPGPIAVLMALVLAFPCRASAQSITGQVVQLGWGEPVGGALVVLLDGGLAQVDSVLSDGQGRFVFPNVPAGTYQLQASEDGEFSTLSDPVRAAPGEAPADVVLLMPSALMKRALACLAGGAEAGTGVVVGVAYEIATRSPLPGAVVRLEAEDGASGALETVADDRGRFHLCRVPAGVPVRTLVMAFGRSGGGERLEVEAGSLHRADIGMSAASVAALAPRLEIVERRATDDPPRVIGRLVDESTDQPIVAAVVAIPEADRETVTDGGGHFRLEGLTAAVHVVEIERLGYGEQTVSLDVPEGQETVVELRLSARPVTLPGVSADARRPMLGLTDVSSSRIVAGAEMAAYERRGASLENVVRERFPIRVQTGVYSLTGQNPRRITCMESRRVTALNSVLAQSDTILEFPECRMIPVFVDDAPVADPGTFVEHVRIEDFETIVYLPPTEVGLRYGLEGNSSGVLLLYTRGRGPFVDRARNVVH